MIIFKEMEQVIILLTVLSACTAVRIPHQTEAASYEIEPITIDRFEAMLHRAGQMLRSPAQVIEPSMESEEENEQQFKHYFPTRPEKNQQVDSKSRHLQFLVPPPQVDDETNFYDLKQKKLPKKFKLTSKQINVKNVPVRERLESETRIRNHKNEYNLNFDDGFFDVDSQVPIPDDIPQEHSTSHGLIAPIYSRGVHKTDDLFATSALNRESRVRTGRRLPVTRFSIINF